MHDIVVAGTALPHYHVCAFFSSREEEYRVLQSFIQDGMRNGEKAIHITDPAFQQDHRERLHQMGISVCECERTGQLEVLNWNDAYLKDGRFDSEVMLALVDEVVRTSQDQGFPRARFIGHMEWVLDDKPGVEQLLEYEVRVNELLTEKQQPAICVYDLNRFSGAAVVDILRTHPYALVDGRLRQNPFYVNPREMVESAYA